MAGKRIVGAILLVLGLAGFLTDGFSFGQDETAVRARATSLELSWREKESIRGPQWLSMGAIAVGALVLIWGMHKS